jgi:hypothetical protein
MKIASYLFLLCFLLMQSPVFGEEEPSRQTAQTAVIQWFLPNGQPLKMVIVSAAKVKEGNCEVRIQWSTRYEEVFSGGIIYIRYLPLLNVSSSKDTRREWRNKVVKFNENIPNYMKEGE